ncbi:DUF3592 domain-containing protein [Reyranella sp. CPCC 100927]|uniref:DUF3592 domain-containing protein n=1 Tax=Reyranella sp. CPCC 100927 TaxID=2599616 RepID=UPI0011B362AD|nr:DUF3592 domain-containing protein [Reyranella sp. CPCC 100927]TWT09680.1 hypothetical protein FQU96_21215 [Reyranella sp. CPCC 100927]
MIGQLLAVPLVWRVGILLSLLAATIVAENLHAFQAEDAEEAALMLRDGRQAAAKPLHASDTITVAVSFGFTRIYRVHYTFADDQGRQWTGGDQITEAEFANLTDPSRPELMRADARLIVLYDPADPTRNGVRSTYETVPGPRMWMVIAAFIAVLITGIGLTWRVHAARSRRRATKGAALPR